jgi:type I restriction enzyme M protein
MRKSLGSKRNEMDEGDIATVTRAFGEFAEIEARELDKPADQKSNRGRQSADKKAEVAKTFASKIFNSYEFGYRRITIERPLRESYQFSDERIEECRFAAGTLNAPMKWLYSEYGCNEWSDEEAPYGEETYGDLIHHEEAIRKHLKIHFPELKEKQIKELLYPLIWQEQRALLLKARKLQSVIGTEQHDDMNAFDGLVLNVERKLLFSVDSKERKQIKAVITWRNPAAEKVIKKIHKGKANPLYGLFEVGEEIIEYQADSELRDNENVALNPALSVNEINEAYFKKEVLPHVPDAWIDASKRDDKDGEIGIVGYEIPFNRHFYQYQPPRDLVEIDADLDAVSAEIMKLLQEVHS